MRILMFPSDLGGGFGHVSRCLALAHEARKRGHACAFMINSDKYADMLKKDFKVYITSSALPLRNAIRRITAKIYPPAETPTPIFTEFSGIAYQVIRDGFIDKASILSRLKVYQKTVKAFRPDVLVGDTNLLAGVLGFLTGTPVVQVVRYAFHPDTARLIWWKQVPEDLVPPDILPLWNPVLESIGASPLVKASDLMKGDLYIVPSVSEIEPVPETPDTVHVGGMVLDEPGCKGTCDYSGKGGYGPQLYVSIGGGAGLVGSKMFFDTVIRAFGDSEYSVFISTSNKFNPADFGGIPDNIHISKWLPGREMIARSSLVVYHGGYATMMETIASARPSIVVPFQTEQESNGRRLEKAGCASVVRLSGEKPRVVKVTWNHGTYTYLVQHGFSATPSMLRDRADAMMKDRRYMEKAEELRKKSESLGGVIRAVDLVESRFG